MSFERQPLTSAHPLPAHKASHSPLGVEFARPFNYSVRIFWNQFAPTKISKSILELRFSDQIRF